MNIQLIRSLLKTELPGEKAQLKMAPSNRSSAHTIFNKNKLRNSGVLLMLYLKNGKLHIPFILRPIYNGAHSGQIGLPGGKAEPFDANMQETAIRETYEEIGITKNKIDILGALTPLFIPHSNFNVFPFVGYCKQEPFFSPDPIEVAKIIEAPLKHLIKPSTIQTFENTIHGEHIIAPYFNVNDHQIWGATAMIISEFKELLLQSEVGTLID